MAKTIRFTQKTQRLALLSTNAFTSIWELCINVLLVRQKLATAIVIFFNCFPFLLDYYYPQIFAKAPADPEKFKKMEEAFEFLNTFLAGSKYAASDNVTVADISLIATVSTFEAAKFDFSKYANVARWYNDCKKTVPGIALNDAGLEEFKKFF